MELSFWQMLPPPPSREAACVKQDLGVSVQVPACSAQLTASIPTGTRGPHQQHGWNMDRLGGTYACVPGTYLCRSGQGGEAPAGGVRTLTARLRTHRAAGEAQHLPLAQARA